MIRKMIKKIKRKIALYKAKIRKKIADDKAKKRFERLIRSATLK